MNIPEMIAKGLIGAAVMVDVSLPKKDDHEHQDHTHQEEPFAEATT